MGSRRRGTALRALTAYLLAQAAFLAALRVLSPRFFWVDDQQAQYVPAFRWFARTTVEGRPPLLDPDAGGGGNFVADPQYGVLDPTHWLIHWAASRPETLLDAAWLLGVVAVLVLGTGAVLVLTTLGVRPALAAAAAVGASSTGFFLWMGSSWWPVMWGTAWLPWLWLGLVRRGPLGLVVTGAAAWQLTASGYPYILVPAGLLVLGHVAEQRRRTGGQGWFRPLLGHLLAGAGGLAAGLPGLLGSQEMASASSRDVPESLVGNTGALIPNLLDAVVGGSTLTPSVSGASGGYLYVVPLAATAAFALPALALVRWRAALREPGVLTALVLVATALLLTQMPTHVGQLRIPFRYLSVSGPAIAMLAALAVTAAPLVTRRRQRMAAALVGVQLLVAVLRGPALLGWHLVAGVLAVAAVGTVAYLAAGSPAIRRPVSVLLVVVATAAPLAGVGAALTTGARQDAQAGQPLTGEPARQTRTRPEWGVTTQEFRDRSAVVDRSVTALAYGTFGPGTDHGWASGVLEGNANLFSDVRPGFGYAAVGHERWSDRWCMDTFGALQGTEECVAGLLETVPGLDLPWVDVLSADEVLLSPGTPEPLREHFASTWTSGGSAGAYARFVRADELPGRVTWASPGTGVGATAGAPADGTFRSGRPGESVTVTTPARGGLLVFRIPAWPGLRAELDGRPLAVGSISDTVLTVQLPGGLHGARVDLYFDPLADRLLVPSALFGALLLGAALLVERSGASRARPDRA